MASEASAGQRLTPRRDAAVEAAVAAFRRIPVNRYRDLGLERARMFADIHQPGPPVASAEDHSIRGGEGQPLTVRVYRQAAGSDVVIVYLHGGGWAMGSLESHDGVCRMLCHGTDASVVAVDYRLAPEHPFPAGLLDAHAAASWATERSDELSGSRTPNLVLAGDSAGANLAAAVCLRARELGGPKVALQILIYPALDERQDHPSLREHSDAPFLDVADVHWLATMYRRPDQADDPLVWPGEAASLAGLPPALVQVAALDALRDSGVAYAERLASAGVDVQLLSYPLYHGFLTITPRAEAARQAIADGAARINGLKLSTDVGGTAEERR